MNALASYHRLRFSLRTLLVAMAVVCLVAVWAGWGIVHHSADEEPDYYVGLAKDEIVQRLGRPTSEWNGHFANPPIDWTNQFEQAESLAYQRAGGTLYISVCNQDGKRICFTSDWLPRGSAY